MAYEFKDEEAENMWVLGNKVAVVGLLMIFGGIIGFINSTRGFDDVDNTRSIIFSIQFVFLIVIGIILFRPSDNFKRIATSEGKDITELMEAIDEFTVGFLISSILIGLIAFLNVILLFDKVF
ncbi:MAG: hypothetical protein HeimC2_11950 [Candidatus Heimdallarchaeota archaeon LC_2]|nr:MAG: hypothetical protein HeimC2_11950 [Candidatus Heimdallarchaeota archaeon LC_2]